ncbi:MAG: hypothetical protein GC161_13745 [Planctomycetaceae bacterium]|nr:hypothetical protein [Planctomycetaceae bacterium]
MLYIALNLALVAWATPAVPVSIAAPAFTAIPTTNLAPAWIPQEESHDSTRRNTWDSDNSRFRYSYIEVGATRFDTENLDDEADTYFAEVSFDILNLVNVFGGYENFSADVDNTDTDLWHLGAGVHFSVHEDLDLTGDVAWLFSQIDSDTIDEDSNGTRVRLGARWMALDTDPVDLELFGHGIALNLDDSFYSDDSLIGFDAGLRVHLVEYLSVAATYTQLEDDDAVGVSARFQF